MTKSRLAVNRRLPIPMMIPAEDRLLAIATAMAAEIAVLRERLDTTQRLLERRGVFEADAIEVFVATAQEAALRDAARMDLIARVFRPLRDDAERATALAKGVHA